MNTPISYLETIRDAVVAALQLVPEFAACSTFAEDGSVTASCISAWKKGDLAAANQARVAATGLAIVVMLVGARDDGSQSTMAFFGRVPLLICIVENVLVNQSAQGTQLGAMWLAERCVANLKEARPGGIPYLIETDPAVDVIQDGTPFRSLFKPDDADANYYTLFVHLFTKAATDQRATP